MRVKSAHTIIIESLISISLNDLRTLGFFHSEDRYMSLPIVIRKNSGFAVNTYLIHVTVNTDPNNSFLELSYEINGEAIKYKIPLVQVANPLTGLFSFYFQCPKTNKKCRKLYLHERYFQHRTGIRNGYYLQTTLSKKSRLQYKRLKKIYRLKKTIEKRSKKPFMTHYCGIYTKRHFQVMQAYSELKETIQTA